MPAICAEPGCPNFRPCPTHPPADRRSPSSHITGTHRWRILKNKILSRDGHLCRLQLPCCTVVATTVDHRIPVAQGGAPYDHDNLQAACKACNDRKGGR